VSRCRDEACSVEAMPDIVSLQSSRRKVLDVPRL
jgi:hypothetical protein